MSNFFDSFEEPPIIVREPKKDGPNGKLLAEELEKNGLKNAHVIHQKKETWSDLEKSDLIDAVDNWLLGYQSKHNNKTERQRPRMVKLKAKLEAQP